MRILTLQAGTVVTPLVYLTSSIPTTRKPKCNWRFFTSAFVNGSTPTTLAYTSTYIHTSSNTAAGTLQILLPLANSSTTQLPSNDRCTSHFAAVLVVAIAVPIILVAISLFSFCMIRRRRPRKEEVATSTQDARTDEDKFIQMYLQQKAELDDEQRRHDPDSISSFLLSSVQISP